MTRAEALKAAEDMVGRQAPTANERGYAPNNSPGLVERIEAILLVADWLCPEFEVERVVDLNGHVIRQIELAKADARRSLEER